MKNYNSENAILDSLSLQEVDKMTNESAKAIVEETKSNIDWKKPQVRTIGVKYQPTMQEIGIYKG
jgi:hypothetical protein